MQLTSYSIGFQSYLMCLPVRFVSMLGKSPWDSTSVFIRYSHGNFLYLIADRPTMTSQLSALEAFDCDGDPTSLGQRWERWKRALEVYLLAAGTDQPLKKRATLLHVGGLGLQDIYYNLPGAHVEENDKTDVLRLLSIS